MSDADPSVAPVRPSSDGAPPTPRAELPGGGGEAATVLDHSQTSDTALYIDRHEHRLKRMRKGVLTAARLVDQRVGTQRKGARPWVPAFLTLTYRPGVNLQARHITDLLKRLRQWGKRRGFVLPYVWVLERGSRFGRLHYHVIVWLPRGVNLPKPDKQGWWPHGFSNIKRARNPVGYLAKYAGKDSAPPPKGFRMHGCGGLAWEDRLERAWWSAPRWVREIWPDPFDIPRPAPGGGWASKTTGEWRESPYVLCGFGAGGVWIRGKTPAERKSA